MPNTLQQPLYPQNLLVDLYELTMAAGYFENHYNPISTFEVFVREMPPNRSFLVAAGLQQVLEYVLNLTFTEDEVAYLRSLPVFKHVSDEFFDYLLNFRFDGDAWAMPEGQIFFPGEPIFRVTAPILEAQIMETFLLSMFNFQSMVASKAARVVHAAISDGKQRTVMEFGSRRAHGPEASILAARAAYIAGCIGTSNVLAGKRFGIPVFGTAAHSWTMAFPSEEEAFRAYHRVFPESTILLIDTYDVLEGARRATRISPNIKGVRIDSGDLLKYSKEVRKILDEAGLTHAIIVASGDLNEFKIERLVKAGAPIDSFGVGTQMATSADAPFLGIIYKLVEQEIDGVVRYRAKFSQNKATYPGKKQVYRIIDDEGMFVKDVIGLEDDVIPENHYKLLTRVIHNGKLEYQPPPLDEVRDFFYQNLARLPQQYKQLEAAEYYPVRRSQKLQDLFARLKEEELSSAK